MHFEDTLYILKQSQITQSTSERKLIRFVVWFQLFDDFIFAFFSLEMTIKMVAMGVFGRGTYLADSWNRLDLFIVLTGAMEYILNVDNLSLSAVRTIRVLRPLRAINRIPSK
jgi:voltage-dependent calcium channel T type alpha-1G